MRPYLIVVSDPTLRQHLRFKHGVKNLTVEKLSSHPGVKAFDISVFPWATFTLPMNKVNNDATPLALTGATFAIFTSQTDATTAAADPLTAANFATALTFSGSAGSYTRATSGGYTLADNGSGAYSISGLDQGTYYLVEIAAPAGYNRVATPVTVVIDSSYNDGSRSSAYVDGHIPDATNDQLTGVTVNGGTQLTVVNQAGVTLPETGGVGTKAFVVGGLALILLALILMIAKKRSASEKY